MPAWAESSKTCILTFPAMFSCLSISKRRISSAVHLHRENRSRPRKLFSTPPISAYTFAVVSVPTVLSHMLLVCRRLVSGLSTDCTCMSEIGKWLFCFCCCCRLLLAPYRIRLTRSSVLDGSKVRFTVTPLLPGELFSGELNGKTRKNHIVSVRPNKTSCDIMGTIVI